MSETKALAPTRAEFKTLRECKTLAEAFSCSEFLDRIKQSAPAHVKPQRMLRTFVQATSRTPKLLQCNMRSVLGAMLTCSEVGLEPNTLLQHAFLIPFERTKWNPETRKRELISVDVQLIFGYPGLLDLAYRSGHVTSVHADVVWKADTFDFSYGTDAHLRHIPSGRHEPNETPLWAYAHASLTNGQAFEAMPWADVLRIRNQTQGFQAALRAKEQGEKAAKPYIPASYTETPWVKHQEAMAKKSAFRSLSKWLPKSVELAGALALDEQQDHSTVDFGAVLDGNASINDGGFIEGEPLDGEESGDPGAAFGDRREPPPLWDQIDNAHADSNTQTETTTRSAPRKAAAKKAAAEQTAPSGAAVNAPAANEATQATGEDPKPPVADPVPAAQAPSTAAAPSPEAQSTQTLASGEMAFSVWLVDGEGAELPDSDGVFEPFTDPVAFARAYVDVRGNLFPIDIEPFEAANADNVEWAMKLHPDAAAIIMPPTPPPPEPAQQSGSPTLPLNLPPVDQAFIPPPAKNTRADFTTYVDRFKALLRAATTSAAIDHLVTVNTPVTERSDFLNSSRLQIKAATEERRKALPAVGGLGGWAATMEQLAVDMIGDIHRLASGSDCDSWAASPAVKTKLLDLSTNDPERHTQVLAALYSHRLLLLIKACKTQAEAVALSREVASIEQVRWLREHAPLVHKNTTVEMDGHVKGLPK